jgi:uncharacterized protein YodC (DUF2158 family)
MVKGGMMDNTIKRGTLVMLKSGGPVMVVDDVGPDAAICVWFAKHKHKEYSFPLTTLTVIDDNHLAAIRGQIEILTRLLDKGE